MVNGMGAWMCGIVGDCVDVEHKSEVEGEENKENKSYMGDDRLDRAGRRG